MTIQQLRNSGYKVKVLHHRKTVEEKGMWGKTRNRVSEKGGMTQVIIDSPSGEHFIGEAVCSKKDNYNKKLGVRIALGRSGISDFLFASHKY